MQQPAGFVNTNHLDYVCRLHKSIYGMKQAPRAWYEKLSNVMFSLGLAASVADTSLFVLKQ